jgi:hypothetical protein
MAKKSTYAREKYKRASTYSDLAPAWRSMNVEAYSGMGSRKYSNPEFKRRVRL